MAHRLNPSLEVQIPASRPKILAQIPALRDLGLKARIWVLWFRFGPCKGGVRGVKKEREEKVEKFLHM